MEENRSGKEKYLIFIFFYKTHATLFFRHAFLKFTSSDNQALVGCIPIPAVTVLLNLKS